MHSGMEENAFLNKFIEFIEDYFSGKLKSKEFIKNYDKLMLHEEFPWESNNPKIQALECFQDELSFYVENPEWRKEYEGYYGDEELKAKSEKVLTFLKDK